MISTGATASLRTDAGIMSRNAKMQDVHEIAVIGDLTEHGGSISEQILDVPFGGSCILYFDCPGGSPHAGVSIMSLITFRRLNATAIVTGECSSAALWPFAACRERYVTPYSVLLFHPSRWESEENIRPAEAAEWARHFASFEQATDVLLAEYFGMSEELISKWMNPGKYVTGVEAAEAGIAKLWPLKPDAGHPTMMKSSSKSKG